MIPRVSFNTSHQFPFQMNFLQHPDRGIVNRVACQIFASSAVVQPYYMSPIINQWSFHYADGGRYVGNFFHGKPWGQGTFYYVDDNRYVGSFVDGRFHGQGTLYYVNGSRYVGSFVAGRFHGQGTLYYVDGSRYVGSFVDGRCHGQGTLYYVDGSRYVGSFVDGRCHGQGTLYYVNGNRYVGSFVEGRFHGQGIFYCFDGNRYEGSFVRDQKEGEATLYYDSGKFSITGVWRKGVVYLDRFYMSHPNFLRCLLNKTEFVNSETFLFIFADYLEKKGTNLSIAADFRSALTTFLSSDDDQFIEEMYTRFEQGMSQLLTFNAFRHAMLLEIVPKEDNLIFRIYNSGSGLRFHSQDLSTGRHQTMLQIQVPKESSDWMLIKNLLNSGWYSVESCYQLLLGLPGAKRVEDPSPIWQRAQKGVNCSLECIFAYFKNKLGEEPYHRMRMEFFDDCIQAVEGSLDPQSHLFLPQLIDKKVKRAARNPQF